MINLMKNLRLYFKEINNLRAELLTVQEDLLNSQLAQSQAAQEQAENQ